MHKTLKNQRRRKKPWLDLARAKFGASLNHERYSNVTSNPSLSKPKDKNLLPQRNKQQSYIEYTNPLITKNYFFSPMTLALQLSDFNLEFRQKPVHTLSAPFQKTDPYPWFISRHFFEGIGDNA
jgi:hypothetical protein